MNTIDQNVSPYLQMPLRSQEQVLEERQRRERLLAEAEKAQADKAQVDRAKAATPAPASTTAPTRVDESV